MGLGTVGSGVSKILAQKKDHLEEVAGRPLRLRGILVRDIGKKREHLPPKNLMTDQAEEILANPDIENIAHKIYQDSREATPSMSDVPIHLFIHTCTSLTVIS